jgi:hypothetical protein
MAGKTSKKSAKGTKKAAGKHVVAKEGLRIPMRLVLK